MTTWLPIPGWEGKYSASDEGHIWSHLTNRVLTPAVRPKGDLVVKLCRDGVGKTFLVHRLVMAAFVGPSPLMVCHYDGNPTNNVLSNLRYGTYSDNARDAVRHGTHCQVSKTHCPQGHEYTPENTRVLPVPARRCRTCDREHSRRQSLRKKMRRLEATR